MIQLKNIYFVGCDVIKLLQSNFAVFSFKVQGKFYEEAGTRHAAHVCGKAEEAGS